MNWQPIETAPIDHEDILLWTPSGMLVGYCYVRDKWHASGVKASHEDCDVELYEAPTHWMPLPSDPSAPRANPFSVDHCGEGGCCYYGQKRPSTCDCSARVV